MADIFLMLGSNKGNKRDYLEASFTLVAQRMGEVVSTSSYYKSQAWGMENSPFFWNRVVVLKTSRSPMQLLESILDIESSFGRKTKSLSGIYQDREIDIDVLFYDQMIFQGVRLSIPHSLLHLRRFVLEPLCELDPQRKHPKFGLTLEELLSRCTDSLDVKRID
ncbi:MAG: 2-amino-4-hydroxy-6-hydroxymethyldihydropteridine diphosphokinase [Flavobacteriales bacterium Tduv]